MDSDAIEERLAHLLRATDEMSDIIADQASRIDRLERRVGLLMEREAGREADDGGTVPVGDEQPPHW